MALFNATNFLVASNDFFINTTTIGPNSYITSEHNCSNGELFFANTVHGRFLHDGAALRFEEHYFDAESGLPSGYFNGRRVASPSQSLLVSAFGWLHHKDLQVAHNGVDAGATIETGSGDTQVRYFNKFRDNRIVGVEMLEAQACESGKRFRAALQERCFSSTESEKGQRT